VITGDHGIWKFPENEEMIPIRKQEHYFRVPLLIYAPGIVKPGLFEDVGSQVDIAPTILDILGIRSENAFVGRSLFLSGGPERFALMVHDRQWNIRRGAGYCYDVGRECFREHYPRCPKGYVPDKADTHSCFDFSGDLLLDASEWQSEPKVRKNRRLRRFAKHLNSYNQSILRKNRIHLGMAKRKTTLDKK